MSGEPVYFKNGRWSLMYTPARSSSRQVCDLALFDRKRHPYEQIIALLNVEQAEDLHRCLARYLSSRKKREQGPPARRPSKVTKDTSNGGQG